MAMALAKSIEAKLDVAGATIDVSTWRWPDHYCSGPDFPVHSDTLVFTLSPSDVLLRIGTDRNARMPASVGNLSFWPAGSYIIDRNAGGEMRSVGCAFKGRWLRDLAGSSDPPVLPSIHSCLDLKSWELCETMSKLARESLNPGFGSAAFVEGLSLQLAVQLTRHFRQLDPRLATARQTLSPWQMKRVLRYLETFSGYTPEIDELAELCGISNRHFIRLFKDTTNQTVHDFARNVWAEKAKALLRDTRMPLRQIGLQSGFSNPNSFTMAFRRVTGQTPTAYRRQHQGS